MLETIVLFIIGFAVLAKSSEYVIDSAIDITRIFGVSEFATAFLLVWIISL